MTIMPWRRIVLPLVALGLCAFPLCAAEKATTCRVQEGETVRDVAARVLGSADLADELIQLNQIADPTQVRPGTLLALPGPEREEALQRLAAAGKAIEAAVARGATQLATAELDAARRTVQAAEAARAAASYSKATALAGVAAVQAREAGELAEKRSSVAETAKLGAVRGAVTRQPAGGAWAPIAAGADVAAGDRLRTADAGGAELTLPDGSAIQLGPAGELLVRELRRDQRTDQRTLTLQLVAGELTGRAAAGGPGTRLEITSTPAALIASGAEFELGRSAAGDTRVFSRAGTVQVAAGAKSATVPAGSGIRIGRGGDLGPVRPRPAAPALAAPWPAGLTTGVARVVLNWGAVPDAASYQVQVAREASFAELAHEEAVPAVTLLTPVLPVGRYVWRVRARTGDGMSGAWSAPAAFETVFDLGARAEVQGPSVTRDGRTVLAPGARVRPVAARAATSIVRFEVQGPDGAWKPFERDVQVLGGGRHVVRFRGVAPDGRTGDAAEATLEVDDLPPGIRIGFGAPARAKDRVGVEVTVDATDPSGLGPVTKRVSGRAWAGGSDFRPATEPLVLERPGRYTVEVRARDALGNEATASAEYTVP